MAKLPDNFLEIANNLGEQKNAMRLGGVVPLKSLWNIAQPELAKKICGRTAEVKAKEDTKGNVYLYIDLPLAGGETKELKVGISDLEEGDIVDVASIIAMFIDTPDGNTMVRYGAIYLNDEKNLCSYESIKNHIINQCQYLMDMIDSKTKQSVEPKSTKSSVIPKSLLNAADKSTYRKENIKNNKSWRGSRFVNIPDESWNPYWDEYSEEEADNFYGKTDGMEGDLW